MMTAIEHRDNESAAIGNIRCTNHIPEVDFQTSGSFLWKHEKTGAFIPSFLLIQNHPSSLFRKFRNPSLQPVCFAI